MVSLVQATSRFVYFKLVAEYSRLQNDFKVQSLIIEVFLVEFLCAVHPCIKAQKTTTTICRRWKTDTFQKQQWEEWYTYILPITLLLSRRSSSKAIMNYIHHFSGKKNLKEINNRSRIASALTQHFYPRHLSPSFCRIFCSLSLFLSLDHPCMHSTHPAKLSSLLSCQS